MLLNLRLALYQFFFQSLRNLRLRFIKFLKKVAQFTLPLYRFFFAQFALRIKPYFFRIAQFALRIYKAICVSEICASKK